MENPKATRGWSVKIEDLGFVNTVETCPCGFSGAGGGGQGWQVGRLTDTGVSPKELPEGLSRHISQGPDFNMLMVGPRTAHGGPKSCSKVTWYTLHHLGKKHNLCLLSKVFSPLQDCLDVKRNSPVFLTDLVTF